MYYPPPRRPVEAEHAVDALARTARENPGLTLVTLGPLTNIAAALSKHPELVSNIGRCVVMGGAPCTAGNVTPAAEYNIWVDPDAARAVFRSGLKIEMVGWHTCIGAAVLDDRDLAEIRAVGTPLSQFALDCNRMAMNAHTTQTGDRGLALADPVAMAVALDPGVVTSASDHYVEIETKSELTRGMTVVDRLNIAGDDRNHHTWSAALAGPRTRVVWSIDAPRWKRLLLKSLGG
jgi:purine nucleosidase